MPILIHDKQYVTVAERVQEAHKAGVFDSLSTEIVQHTPQVIIKATVTIKGKTYTGISAANQNKVIEKMSPYEVAETSAVGRALGFAGFGVVESIATADEIIKAESQANNTQPAVKPTTQTHTGNSTEVTQAMLDEEAKRRGPCPDCGAPMRVSSKGNVVCSEACWLKGNKA